MKKRQDFDPEKYLVKCMKWLFFGDFLAIVFGIFIDIPFIAWFGCGCLIPAVYYAVLCGKKWLRKIDM